MKLFFLCSKEAQSDSYGQGRFFSQTHDVSLQRDRSFLLLLPERASLLNIFRVPFPFFFLFLQFIRPSSLKPLSRSLSNRKSNEKEEKETCFSLRHLPPPSLFCCIRAKRKINIFFLFFYVNYIQSAEQSVEKSNENDIHPPPSLFK